MSPDALAAVVAAARLLLARATVPAPAKSAERWALTTRLGGDGAPDARLLARARSRWAMGGRLRG